MTGRTTRRIGVLVELTRQFGRDLCQGITDYTGAREGLLPFFITPETLKDKNALRSFDGFIARVMNDAIAKDLAACRKPVVDVYYDKPRLGFGIVKTNHARIGRLAAQHFLMRRHRNFAFCGFSGGRFSAYCLRAFRLALCAEGHSCHTYLPDAKIRYTFNRSVLINERMDCAPDTAALSRWLAALPKPVAVFCPNDLRAWQLLQVCRENDLDVPHDIALLGLDNDFVICGFSHPMISSIDPDTSAIGREAARLLVEMMNDPNFRRKTPVRQILPRSVVERASTAAYPLAPAWLSDALVYMRQHVAERLTAADIFAYLGLSHTIVDATFRSVLHTSVQKEIAAARLEKARQLLETTTLSAALIAEQSGFASTTYFMRAFSNAHGVSPIMWREQRHPQKKQLRISRKRPKSETAT